MGTALKSPQRLVPFAGVRRCGAGPSASSIAAALSVISPADGSSGRTCTVADGFVRRPSNRPATSCARFLVAIDTPEEGIHRPAKALKAAANPGRVSHANAPPGKVLYFAISNNYPEILAMRAKTTAKTTSYDCILFKCSAFFLTRKKTGARNNLERTSRNNLEVSLCTP
jgi:hypothetical protein